MFFYTPDKKIVVGSIIRLKGVPGVPSSQGYVVVKLERLLRQVAPHEVDYRNVFHTVKVNLSKRPLKPESDVTQQWVLLHPERDPEPKDCYISPDQVEVVGQTNVQERVTYEFTK